jgi:hypothetical protein
MANGVISPIRTFRVLAAALMGALVIIAIALSFVVGNHRSDRNGNPVPTHAPGAWMYVVIVAIALLFAGNSNTVLPYLVAAVIAELLMAYHVWPSTSLISRVQQRLDRNGGQSDLANALNGTE